MKIHACILSVLLTGGAFAASTVTPPATTTTIAKHAKILITMGTVASTDMIANTLMVEGKKKVHWTFSVPASAKIMSGKTMLTLGDIKADSKVKVMYTKDGDVLVANLIKIWPAKKTTPTEVGKK